MRKPSTVVRPVLKRQTLVTRNVATVRRAPVVSQRFFSMARTQTPCLRVQQPVRSTNNQIRKISINNRIAKPMQKTTFSPISARVSSLVPTRLHIKPTYTIPKRSFVSDVDMKKSALDTLASANKAEKNLQDFVNSVEYRSFTSVADAINTLHIPAERALGYIEVLAEKGINSTNFGDLDENIADWGINNGEDLVKILHAAQWYKYYKKIPAHHFQNLPNF